MTTDFPAGTPARNDTPAPGDPRLSRLSLNTATTKRLTVREAADAAVRWGIPTLGLWRDRIQEVGPQHARTIVEDAGLTVSSLCRGGFLTASADAERATALADNQRAIDECVTVGTSELIMVVGGIEPGTTDLAGARGRVQEALGQLAPYAQSAGVRLVLEALHPMYVADRAVLSTLGQANDMAEPFDPAVVGVVVDTFHVWWDPDLQRQIARAGQAGRIASYQVCDWILPIASDALLSRGMMGDGFIDFATIGRWVADAGYTGPVEVEIFNQDIWDASPDVVLPTMTRRYVELVEPFC